MSKNLKILYIQIREDEETALEEFLSFVKYSTLQQENFTTLNVFKTPKFEASEVLKNHDALFVGGSSDATVLSKEKKFKLTKNRSRKIQFC